MKITMLILSIMVLSCVYWQKLGKKDPTGTKAPVDGILFATGFESEVTLASPGTTTQYFATCETKTCENTENCSIGCVDASTGFNVPADIPGAWRVHGDQEPVWNFVGSPSNVVLEINTNMDFVRNGTRSLRTWQNFTDNSRAQFNIYPTTDGEMYDNLAETITKRLIYIDRETFGEGWLLIEEWFSVANRIILYSGGIQFLINGTSCNINTSRCLTYTTNAFPLGEWVELITHHKLSTGTSENGSIIMKYKTIGGSEVVVFNDSGRNNYGADFVGAWNPIKNYGSIHSSDIYFDDFIIYDPAVYNETNLPSWD